MDKKSSWSFCPSCLTDLSRDSTGRRRPFNICPNCHIELLPVWWIRVIWAVTGTLIAFLIPIVFHQTGLALLFVAMILWVPAFIGSGMIGFNLIPLRYARKSSSVTKLFCV